MDDEKIKKELKLLTQYLATLALDARNDAEDGKNVVMNEWKGEKLQTFADAVLAARIKLGYEN